MTPISANAVRADLPAGVAGCSFDVSKPNPESFAVLALRFWRARAVTVNESRQIIRHETAAPEGGCGIDAKLGRGCARDHAQSPYLYAMSSLRAMACS